MQSKVTRMGIVVLFCMLLGGVVPLAHAQGLRALPTVPGLGADVSQVFPPVTLRGYGRVEGTVWRYPGTAAGASILQMRCADEAQARLTLAKYLSDLEALPGVTRDRLDTPLGPLSARLLTGQGALTAFRAGREVFILAAGSSADLVTLYTRGLAGDRAGLVFRSEVEVPMYLDRWDRFGFRFYYYPWTAPKGQTFKTYDPYQEFEYAAAHNRAGFLFWDPPLAVDTAEGMMNYRWNDWGMNEARALKLPVGWQLSYGPTTWLANRYREETAQKMPQYVGDRYGPANDFDGGQGAISWNSETAKLVQLSQMQQSVRDMNGYENLTSWLEPNSELQHGAQDILIEYGPVADKTFRTFLREKYGSLEAVSRRWTGAPGTLKSWEEVRVPELAAFAGWSGDALDLAGTWRVGAVTVPAGQEKTPPPPPAEWRAESFDDSAWPTIVAPGHDRTMFIPKQPALYRRTFTVPAAWRQAHQKAWVYLWDLNTLYGQKVPAYLNGQPVGESLIVHPSPHWAAYEVSGALRAGDNVLAVYLPQGYLAYRVYLSATPPLQYPNLGLQLNARWADFSGWNTWSRVRVLDRSMQMIRQVDPNRGLSMAAPDGFAGDVKVLSEKYGGEFHNTGYMGGFWAEYLPMLMRGAGLPMSLEPGGPASDLQGFKTQMGLYATEGIQGIDYFIHVGDILWNDEIRKHFEEHQNEIRLIGKYYVPQAEVAELFSSRITSLTGFPWGRDPNNDLQSGYWRWNMGEYLRNDFQRDGLVESDFFSGNANRYRVVLDTNTSVMEDSLVDQIEKYVRAGGVFVTYVQTGRHTPEGKDAWPISRLTGYQVVGIDQHNPDGTVVKTRNFTVEPGQTMFRAEDWTKTIGANGLSLQKVAPECRDLLRWADGSVAAGLRPLGKGYVLCLGVKFAHDRIWSGNPEATKQMFTQILDYFQVAHVPAVLNGVTNEPYVEATHNEIRPTVSHAGKINFRHFVSNSGLYNVWVMWNPQPEPATVELVFGDSVKPDTCVEVRTMQPVALSTEGGRTALKNLALEPLETRIFLTPRHAVAEAPAAWFTLQRGWWQGATKPTLPPLPPFQARFALDLSDDWAFQPITDEAQAAALTAPRVDTTGWERMRLGIWTFPDHRDVKHAVLRKSFTVPAAWDRGPVALWLQCWLSDTFVDEGRVWLDGKLLRDFNKAGLSGDPAEGVLTAGSTHELVVEVRSQSTLSGSRGSTWLAYRPTPQATQDLAGEWLASRDALVYDRKLTLPGTWDAKCARRTVVIDPAQAGRNVMMHTEGRTLGVMINGKWIRRFHHLIGNRLDLNITPWVKFGEPNEIELVGDGKYPLTQVSLDFFDKQLYP